MEKIQKDIENIQTKYYDKNSKNQFFKNTQKANIAKQVCSNIDIEQLLLHTLEVKENTVTIEYPVLKLFCHDENHDQCITYILNKFKELISKYDNYNCVINLDTFTISSADRHRKLIEKFCGACLNDADTQYSENLKTLYIINSPNIMESLYKLFNSFIVPTVKSKITLVSKK
tara:strand:- start:261 stop:779 length:519 start_codon:yes stop_codon:yes gene_type:complete